MPHTFATVQQWKNSVEQHEKNSQIDLESITNLTTALHGIPVDSSHLSDAQFFIEQVYNSAKRHNEKLHSIAQKMKSESFKKANIEGYGL